MRRIVICIGILLFCAVATSAREAKLTVQPAKAPEPLDKYQLLPRPQEQTEADAAPLYEKAIESLPKDFQTSQVSQWAMSPWDESYHEAIESTLRQFKPTLQLLEQAAKCKKCDWPYVDDDTLSEKLHRYRVLLFLLALQVRFQIVQGHCDKAIATVQTGFGVAKHLGEGPALVQGFVGIAVGALICRQLEQFVQGLDAPNLYWALRSLPRPFIDLTEQTELEDPDIREKAHLLMHRLDCHIAALQCIEAIRLYAANHKAELPAQLNEITEVATPDNPVTDKPFEYRLEGSSAVLAAASPQGGTERDSIHYEVTVRK